MKSETYIYPTGFEDAIIGADTEKMCFILDKYKMCEILMYRDGMSEEEAIEYCEFNVWNAYIGEHTPIYVECGTLQELIELLEL